MKKIYMFPQLNFSEKIESKNILLGIVLSDILEVGEDADVDMEEGEE